MEKIIIGLVGPMASGKGEAKKYLQEKYGATEHRFSTMLRDLLDRMHVEQSRTNIQDISTILRQRFGEDLLAKVLTEDVKNDIHELIIIDGIRRNADIEYLEKLPGFTLVSIDADEKLRYERMIKRNENAGDGEKSFADFQKDSQAETELTIPGVMAHAKVHLQNNNSLEELRADVDKLLDNLRR
ncbi:MAG: AAA family ATPase [Candidatus Falkowbacteria bacterium]|nr:AAA family ATPase [Candidatus Falkowbacteria bacterium]